MLHRPKLLAFALLSYLVFIPPADAFSLGNFHRTCYAPNWMTGSEERVLERNVYDQPGFPFMAFTKRLPGGRWQIEWNVPRIEYAGLSDLMIVFLFYHECAHAQFNDADEAVADCGGLLAMANDIGITDDEIAEIAFYYRTRGDGRQFPPPGCI